MNAHLTSNEQALLDVAEYGWVIIANAGGGNWDAEHPEWAEAAAKYRDQFHALATQLNAKVA